MYTNNTIAKTTTEAIELLKKMISTQSFSSQEEGTAEIIAAFLESHGIKAKHWKNNVWAANQYFDSDKPTILLNSHHDTVKPNSAYTMDPLKPIISEGKLYGLGSNDAGASVVSLLTTFAYFYNKKKLKYNLIVAITAEEESSGPNGLNSLLTKLPKIDFAIVGEPTEMQLAIAEKGLLVIDAYAKGVPGHAAHGNTVNPIYKAMEDIQKIQQLEFDKISDVLGKVKTTVTQIDAGSQHNVVPAECHFVLDVRVNENYSNLEVLDILKKQMQSELKARSTNLNSSSIPVNHPVVQAGISLGRKTYGSPTLSDQSVLSCPSLKLGVGKSTRSHTANEFIYLHEIEEGIQLYREILEKVIIEEL